MNELTPILADSADEMIKLILGGLFVLIWIVGGLMSATKKKPPKSRTPEKSWDEIFRELSGDPNRPQPPPPPPPPLPPARREPLQPAPLQRPVPPTPASGPPSGPAVRKKLRRRHPARPVPAPPPLRVDPEPAVPHMPVLEVATGSLLPPMASDIAHTEIGSGKPNASRAAGLAAAKELRASLRPENLRNQFILTELLQPPKALRGEV